MSSGRSRGGRVYLADGTRNFNRSGPGVMETLEILVEILHGAGAKCRGSGWLPANRTE